MADEVLVTSHDHICTVTLNRPHKRNALNAAMVSQLRAAFERVAADATVRLLIVRASGPAFCAGLDLREMAAQREAGEADLGGLEKVLEDLEACPQPTIAAVQVMLSPAAASWRCIATSASQPTRLLLHAAGAHWSRQPVTLT
jgi:enoyl-CoA hydratase/carnithine racemase